MARLVIVSNRVGADSSSQAHAGGLAIAIRSALERKRALWFGWSGELVDTTPDPPRLIHEGQITRALIDLPRDDFRHYYAGFANRALWPLFHYRTHLAEFNHDEFVGYRRINEIFAKLLVPLLQPGDLIWVHDYHLLLLGEFLRANGVTQQIGFFLHTPFPCPEVLTTLPVHDELFKALAAYNLVGFQSKKDFDALGDYVEREARGEVFAEGLVTAYGRRFHAGVFPIGIDPETTAARAKQASCSQSSRRLNESLSGRKLVIGVDRLDYSKGLLNRFKAVESLFEEYPEQRRNVVVLQIASPTRGDVPEYRQLRSALDELMGHINGRFGEPELLPVRYINRQFSQDTLFGFYRLSAVGLVTPLRDGMNLVAKEYVASQDSDDPGVLILSRFAGAAQEMDAAVIVNPFDPRAMTSALQQGLTMPLNERRERHEALMRVLNRNTITTWRDSFLQKLAQCRSYRNSARATDSHLALQ